MTTDRTQQIDQSGAGGAPPEKRPKRVMLTEDGRLKSGRLAGLSMGAAIWVLSWPVLTESFLNSLVGMTDTVLAAGLGEAETDAVGGASYFMWFIGLVIMALGVGATALISRAVGGGKMAVANAALGQTLVLGVVCGSLAGALIYVSSGWLAGLLSMEPESADAFRSYLGIIALGTPAAGVLFCGIACARGAGDSIRPLWAMVARNAVNIVVSFVLSGVDIVRPGESGPEVIFVNPSPFDLGVLGIALGTVLGDLVGALIILSMARSGVWGIRLRARRLKPHWHTMKRVIRVGVPNFFETLGMWVGNFLVIMIVGWIGAGSGGPLGAHIVAIRIEAFSFLPGFAMGIAAATLAGQYLGAGSVELARKAVVLCMLIGAGVMGVLGILFVVYPTEIVGFISAQPAHLELAPPLLIACGLVQVPFGMAIVFRQAMRGAGDVRMVMAITWITTYAVRLPLVYIFSGVDIARTVEIDGVVTREVLLENPFGFEPSLTGVWVGMCIELVIRGVVFTARFMQGGWARAKV
ncbi:MAG: MATE family efflux transporter [Planctomycetota bacterium]